MPNERTQQARRRPPETTAPGGVDGAVLRTDGRLERRRRNRRAVLDAYLDLTRDGAADPTMEQLADVAGVSHRSVFRYFDDRSALVLAAAAHVIERLEPVIFVEGTPTGPVHDRVGSLVAARVAGFHTLGWTAARIFARGEELVPRGLDPLRARLRDDLAARLAPALDALDTDERALRLDLADLPFQFEPLGLLGARVDGDRDALAARLTHHLVTTLRID